MHKRILISIATTSIFFACGEPREVPDGPVSREVVTNEHVTDEPVTDEPSTPCAQLPRDFVGLDYSEDALRVERATEAFTRLQAQLELETDPLSRAQCLAGMAIATFYQTPGILLMNTMPEHYPLGRVQLDAALALLDTVDAPSEDAALCLDVADHFPWIFASAMNGPHQVEITEAKDALLLRAAKKFESVDDKAGALKVLRALPHRSAAQLERSIALAIGLEAAPTFERAKDLETLSQRVNQRDPLKAIGHMTDSVAILGQDPTHARDFAEALLWLGLLHKRAHHRAEAIENFSAALSLYLDQGEDRRVSYAARFLGSMALESGDLSGATEYYTLALKHQGSPRDVGESLIGIALTQYIGGQPELAMGTLGEGRVPSWEILASEFDKFFDTPVASGIQRSAAALFKRAGESGAAASILRWTDD